MLRRLSISNLAIIEGAQISFTPGLNVLSGETGAGKSIIVDALGLALGARADTGLVRAGADSALVTAEFEGQQIETLSRRVGGSRSVARIDGEPVTVQELAEAARALASIHAQHATQVLATPGAHLAALDRLLPGPAVTALAEYRAAFQERAALLVERDQLLANEREGARRQDMLTFQVKEIDSLALQPDETDRLHAERERLRHAQQIAEGIGLAASLLEDDEINVGDLLARALRSLESAARYDPSLGPLHRDLQGAAEAARAVARELQAAGALEADPRRLEAIESRLDAIEKVQRKYGATITEVLEYRDRAAAELAGLESSSERLADLEARRARLETVCDQLAAQLTDARAEAASTLEQGVARTLRDLAMAKAVFTVRLGPRTGQLGPGGRDEVEFWLAANPGEPAQPLDRVASGGELSRVMLAIAGVADPGTPTLVFDEIDSGIGGEAARAVGDRLRRVSRGRQVLVVTHLPQIAAFAENHLHVTKLTERGRTVVEVHRLEGEPRVEELARMLGGTRTDVALKHARELLGTSRP